MNRPFGIALDLRPGISRLCVADTGNNRVLCWNSIQSADSGAPADFVLGQISSANGASMGAGSKGFSSPVAVVINPLTGDVYVADYGSDRILRFRSPFDVTTPGAVIEPDLVLGRAGFTDLQPSMAPSASSLSGPSALAVDSGGNLWVADTGYNRVIRYGGGALLSGNTKADLVLGQANLQSGEPNQGGEPSAMGLSGPSGLAFDDLGRLYVADTDNNRVLRYSPPFYNGQPGTWFMADPSGDSEDVEIESIPGGMAGPVGIATTGGKLFVALPSQNRVLIADATGAVAHVVSALGQPTPAEVDPNNGTYPLASAFGLRSCRGVQVDKRGTVFVADTGNNRVLTFPVEARTATTVWGQADLVSGGVNRTGPEGLSGPRRIAVDYSRSPFALYVSDTENHRVLVWKDVNRFRTGEPAELVIGQPDMRSSAPNVDSRKPDVATATSLAFPAGVAVAADGTLYVADSGNNRVLKYERPVDQTGRIKATAVLGQTSFSSTDSGTSGDSSFNVPSGLALSSTGELFVADTDNHRVLQFPPDPLTGARAFRVFGQPDLTSRAAAAVSAASLTAPQGVAAFQGALYVADTGANRLVVYGSLSQAPAGGATATFVLGQTNFYSSDTGTGATRMSSPVDVSVGASGSIAVADRDNNRVLLFPPLTKLLPTGGAASGVVGQADFDNVTTNTSTIDGLVSASSLESPNGLSWDRNETLYVADTQNNRILHFLRSASLSSVAPVADGFPVAPGSRGRFTAQSLDLAATEAKPPLPLAITGIELIIDDVRRAPLVNAKGSVIDIQVPSSLAQGTHRIAARVVSSGDLLSGTVFDISSAAPGLFTREGTSFGLIVNSDGTDNSSVNMAARGSVVRVLGTGQGAVIPPVSDGESAAAGSRTVAVPAGDPNSCWRDNQTVCAFIDEAFAPVQTSELAPGMVGVWQLTVRVPESLTGTGQKTLRAVVSGISSNVVGIWIR